MSIDGKIKCFGEGVKDRLDPEIVDYDLDYIRHAESTLAFETLCDHIANYDVLITKDEYEQIVYIAKELGLELDSRYLYINPET